jgi:hypothetical protein
VEVSVFDFLEGHPSSFAMEVLFYVIRMLRHANSVDSLDLDWLRARFADNPNSKEFPLAVQLLQSIELSEGSPIRLLRPERREHYSKVLTDLFFAHSNRDYQPDPERGRRLLEELRKQPV